jgi:hypothetical protein
MTIPTCLRRRRFYHFSIYSIWKKDTSSSGSSDECRTSPVSGSRRMWQIRCDWRMSEHACECLAAGRFGPPDDLDSKVFEAFRLDHIGSPDRRNWLPLPQCSRSRWRQPRPANIWCLSSPGQNRCLHHRREQTVSRAFPRGPRPLSP